MNYNIQTKPTSFKGPTGNFGQYEDAAFNNAKKRLDPIWDKRGKQFFSAGIECFRGDLDDRTPVHSIKNRTGNFMPVRFFYEHFLPG